eukprot:4815137-Lingulodinium_polyedra.AAC.1
MDAERGQARASAPTALAWPSGASVGSARCSVFRTARAGRRRCGSRGPSATCPPHLEELLVCSPGGGQG